MPSSGILAKITLFFATILAFAVLASVLPHHYGFPLDDAWIHQTIARNLVDTHVLGFLPGAHSSGSSSLLWTLILAFNYRFLPSVPPVIYCAIINGILLGLTAVYLKSITEEDGIPPAESWLIALAPILSGNFLWFGLIGLEHVLFVVLSIALISTWFRKRITFAAILYFLLILTRPEGIFLGLLLIPFRKRSAHSLRDCSWLALSALTAEAITFRVNWLASHTFLPITMKGRQWVASIGITWYVQRFIFIIEWFLRILMTWKIQFYRMSMHRLTLYFTLSVCGFAAIAWAAIALYRRGKMRISILLLWAIAITLLYLVILPTEGHGGRYQPLRILLVLPFMYLLLLQISRRVFTSLGISRKYALATVIVCVALSTIISLRSWRFITGEGIDQINQEHGAMAQWLTQNLPSIAITQRRIAVFDIGRIGYQFHGSLVDLGGLTDAQYLPFLIHNQVPEYLKEHQVQYLVLPTLPDGHLPLSTMLTSNAALPFKLHPLETICYPVERTMKVFAGTRAAFPCQTAYVLRFDDVDKR